ncbi:hypothetical protein [Chamaesiphon sp.]|uniref:hypothetical protein n=1 Tax=Chamaesiphon sp. TaxID=2814140 RepID=UPI00359379F0
MVAAQKFNRAKGQELPIYGSVTTGTFWQFLKLTGQDLTIDVKEYSLKPIERILGILKWTITSRRGFSNSDSRNFQSHPCIQNYTDCG